VAAPNHPARSERRSAGILLTVSGRRVKSSSHCTVRRVERAKRTGLRRRLPLYVGTVLLAGVFAIGGQYSPYARLDPGPSSSVSAGVTGTAVVDPHGDDGGAFLMVTVDVRRLSWIEYLSSKFPWSDMKTLKIDTTGAARTVMDQSMDASKRTAALVAEQYVFQEVANLTADGAEIIEIAEGSPAAKSGLKVGDVVVQAAGAPVSTAEELSTLTKAASGAIEVVVRREPHQLMFTVTPKQQKIGVRVETQYRGEPVVSVDTPGVGGASAGLSMTLAFIDAMSPGDLTGGVRVAATGTIDEAGRVGSIRGIDEKTQGAVRGGAKFMFAPADDVVQGAKHPLTVVPVATLDAAVRYLCMHGATDKICDRLDS
jgi:PDZ domain-containing protein